MLQVERLMRRLRPNSVSSGSTLRQFDSTEQSPQPSQTRSLMTAKTRRVLERAALAAAALLGGAGLLVDEDGDAGDLAQLALDGVELAAGVEGGAGGEAGAVELFRVVGDQRDAARRLRRRTVVAMASTLTGPSTGWPPVMATASL